MFEGYLKVGDTEIINSARARGYAQSASCPVAWHKSECDGLVDALLEPGRYVIASIEDAPWYDQRNPESARFYGASGLSLGAISSSTLQADQTEGITDGGVAGSPRLAGKTVRVRAWLTAEGQDALEYGMAWLRAAVRGRRCAQHGASCGGAAAEFFTACPPVRALVHDDGTSGALRPQTDEEYLPGVISLQRFLHGVSAISGPLEVQTVKRGLHWGREVEFTLYAEQPGIYAPPRDFGTLVAIGEIVDDIIRNQVPYPSAELGENEHIVAYNHVANPSLELNDAGWTGGLGGGDDAPGSPAIGSVGSGVVIGARSFAGNASYLVRWRGDGATVGSGSRILGAEYELKVMPGLAPGDVVTVSIWAALVVESGTPLDPDEEVNAFYYWVNSAGATVGSSVGLGAAAGADRGGVVLSIAGQVVPSGATGIRILLRTTVFAYSSPNPAVNRDVRLYADAAGVIEEV